MVSLDQRLDDIRKQIDRGVKPPPVTVRELLSWVSAERRGLRIAKTIRSGLDVRDLSTIPDFDSAFIDQEIQFIPADQETSESAYWIGGLAAANNPPLCVKPDTLIAELITKMMYYDYSRTGSEGHTRKQKNTPNHPLTEQHPAGPRLASELAIECLSLSRHVS